MVGKLGPVGGTGGGAFDAPPPAGPWKILQISGATSSYIFTFQVEWTDGATSFASPVFGGPNGEPFQFNVGTTQYLTGISGQLAPADAGSPWLTAIRFALSDGTRSPRYGNGGGTPFSLMCPPGKHIVGFFGRSGTVIDALGVYIDDIPS